MPGYKIIGVAAILSLACNPTPENDGREPSLSSTIGDTVHQGSRQFDPWSRQLDQPSPQVVEFYSPYCSACQEAARVIAELAHRCEDRHVVLKKVDVSLSGNEPLQALYDIRVLPTLVFLSETGKEVKRLEGGQINSAPIICGI